MRKTNSLLIAIALIFVVSWLPLNILNILAEFYFPFDSSEYRILFACCHMIGMSSACSNPLLYGWLNDNFKKEFREIFSTCCSCCAPERRGSLVTRGSKTGHGGGGNYGRDKTESVIIVTKSTALTDTNGTSKNSADPNGVTEKFETIVITAPE